MLASKSVILVTGYWLLVTSYWLLLSTFSYEL